MKSKMPRLIVQWDQVSEERPCAICDATSGCYYNWILNLQVCRNFDRPGAYELRDSNDDLVSVYPSKTCKCGKKWPDCESDCIPCSNWAEEDFGIVGKW